MSANFETTRVMDLLVKLELEPQPLREATELFWVVSTEGAGPETPMPELLDRMRQLAIQKKVPYDPDVPQPLEELYVFAHLEAARLCLLLESSGYSEETRVALDETLRAFVRCDAHLSGDDAGAPWSWRHSAWLDAVASFAYAVRFSILRSDGQYERALVALSEAVKRFREAPIKRFLATPEEDDPSLGPWPEQWPWLTALDPGGPVSCFEAIRARGQASDPTSLSAAFAELATGASAVWGFDENNLTAEELDGWLPEEHEAWESKDWSWLTGFWHAASGWLDATLSPSELRKVLQEREDEAAERRLRHYFFGEELWMRLPERARRSLTSADRDWFSSALTRRESILNELRIATEELLFHGLWMPLCRWGEARSQSDSSMAQLDQMRFELDRLQPALVHFEKVCRMEMTKRVLEEWGIPESERQWVTQRLPKALKRLRLVRRHSEHEWSEQPSEMQIGELFSEFVGIGCDGVLRRLAFLLLANRPA